MFNSQRSLVLLIKFVGITFCLTLLQAGILADSNQLLLFYRQSRKSVPKVSIGQQTYIPVIDLLNFLDLPYSESVSAGFVQITAGKQQLRLTKGDSQALLNGQKIGLGAPVTVLRNQWLVPLEFFDKALERTLGEKIGLSESGNAAVIGESGFTRLNAKVIDKNKVLRVQASRAVAAEVRQLGSRVVLAFANAPMDLGSADTAAAEWIRSITLEQSESANQLVIDLAENVRTAKISHLASQNAYTVEPILQDAGEATATSSGAVLSVTEPWKWRHITVDAGHGGLDRGTAIREALFEKDVALAIARKLRWALESRLGVTVVLSRSEDQAQKLEDRIAAANLARSNLFISVHTGNATASPAAYSYAYTMRWIADEASPSEAKGTRSLFVPWEQAQRGSLVWSEKLAECVQAEMNRALNGGQPLIFRRGPIRLLSALAMPAVLVEIGNSHAPDFQAKANNDSFQNLVAATLAAAVEKFRPLHERP